MGCRQSSLVPMALAMGLGLWGAGNQALAGSVAINNPGFEADFTDPGCFSLFTPTGWSLFDPNGIKGGNDLVGIIDPTGTTNYPGGAPEGLNVALVFLDGEVGQGSMGLSQVLAATLQADTRYTLSVDVGNIDSGQGPPPCDVAGFFNLSGFPGYQVQLLAGGEELAIDDNELAGVIPDGEFARTTISATIGASHRQIGLPLEIRLINLNIPGTKQDPGIEVNFDDVVLTAEPAGAAVPAASIWGMIAMALALVVCGILIIGRRTVTG